MSVTFCSAARVGISMITSATTTRTNIRTVFIMFSFFLSSPSFYPPRNDALLGLTAHCNHPLLIPLHGLPEQRQKLLLERYELHECIEHCRRRHRPLIMPAHGQIPVSGHVVGGCLQLSGDTPKLLRQLHMGVVFLP